MVRPGYRAMSFDDKTTFDLDIVSKLEDCRTRPEAVRRLVHFYRQHNVSEFEKTKEMLNNQKLNKEKLPTNNNMGLYHNLTSYSGYLAVAY